MATCVRVLAGAATALAAVAASAATAATVFSATLTGDQEVATGSGSPFTGTADFKLMGFGTPTPSLAYQMLFDPGFDFGLAGSTGSQQVVGLHIHNAPRGANGAVIYGILSPSSEVDNDVSFGINADGSTSVTGEWDWNEGTFATFQDVAGQFAEAAQGDEVPFYVNLHTVEFPAGEIRGQISAVPLPATLPLLAGGLLLLLLKRRTA